MRAHTPAGRTLTYLTAAAAVGVFILGFALIGWYADSVRPSGAGPAPTVTVTNPAETITQQAPRRPRKYVTETVEVRVPGPTVTVTETVETPGPTVTVTETVTATPDATVLGASVEPVGPMVLSIDTDMSAGWQVERAARIWNRALGCDVFTTDVPAVADGQPVYWVTEVDPGSLMFDGQHVRALHTGNPVWTIEFDAKWGVESFIAVHELGHALGLSHGDEPGSIMNVSDRDRHLPTAADVERAKSIQTSNGRCQP